MNFTRSIKKCESWVACAYMADKETIGFEHHPDRKVLYQYVYYKSTIWIGKRLTSYIIETSIDQSYTNPYTFSLLCPYGECYVYRPTHPLKG